MMIIAPARFGGGGGPGPGTSLQYVAFGATGPVYIDESTDADLQYQAAGVLIDEED